MLLLRTSRGVDPGIPLLRSLGSNAHVWLPGANGVSVASLPSNNYLLSAGSTGYSTVDGVDGLTLDGMGSLGVERITNGDFSNGTTGWTAGAGATFTVSSGVATIGNNGNTGYAGQQLTGLTVGNTYLITATLSNLNVATPDLRVGTGAGNFNYLLKSGLTAGPISVFHVAAATSAYFGFSTGSVAGVATFDVDNISVKEYTGTHLTQATTANKPLVRRGAYNLLSYSNDFTNAVWGKVSCSVSGFTLTATAGTAYHYIKRGTPIAVDGVKTYAIDVKRVNNDWVFIGIDDPNLAFFNLATGLFGTVSALYTEYSATLLSDGYYRIKLTSSSITSAQCGIGPAGSNGGGSFAAAGTEQILLRYAQLEEGATTAGDYTPTTTTAASNPSAGKYWWHLDGSNDSLLSGNLGITNACTIVIAGRVNALSGFQGLLMETTNGVAIYVNADGSVDLAKVGVAQVVTTAAGVIVAGVPFVIAARLSSGTAVIRKNGAQVATAASGLTFSAVTGARVGTLFNGTSNPLNGALGWVVALPVALSDADCLTVERLVGSQFPGMATF